jgi:hypothetical protein
MVCIEIVAKDWSVQQSKHIIEVRLITSRSSVIDAFSAKVWRTEVYAEAPF